MLAANIPEDKLKCTEKEGWLQRAFVLSFYFLLRFDLYQEQEDKFYHDCIRITVQQGGDTDTNAAIVGGMVGALVGLKLLPDVVK